MNFYCMRIKFLFNNKKENLLKSFLSSYILLLMKFVIDDYFYIKSIDIFC